MKLSKMIALVAVTLFCLPALGDSMFLSDAPAYLWTLGCGPTAAASVFGYWDLHGYDDMLVASGTDVFSTGNVTNEIAELATLMGTTNGWTYLSEMAPSMTTFASQRNYSFTASSLSYSSTSWSFLTNELRLGDPFIALVDTNADGVTDHFVPVFGYSDNDYCYYTTWTESETPVCSPFEQMAVGQSWGVGYVTLFEPNGSPPIATPEPSSLLTMLAAVALLPAMKKSRARFI